MMLHALRVMSVTVLLAGMVFSGCVTTTLQVDWRDPGFTGRFKKVIVICLVNEMVVRNTLEDEMVAQFSKRGIDAVPGYTLFASFRDVDKEAVRRKVREINADGVLLVRTVGKDTIQNYSQRYDVINNYYNGWGALSQQTYMAPQITSVEMYRVETSLYEAANGDIVWQAVSDTYEDTTWMEMLKSFSDLMTKKLIEHGLM